MVNTTPNKVWEHARDHPLRPLWQRFYNDAWRTACDIAAGTPFEAETVAKVIAALSPMKPWDENVTLARRAVAVAATVEDHSDYNAIREAVSGIGAMGTRLDATAKALAWQLHPPGPKVSAFAYNIMGNLTFVTVDRHMMDIFGHDPEACRAYCLEKARAEGIWPAEVQAVLWGAWRDLKGYPAYDTTPTTEEP